METKFLQIYDDLKRYSEEYYDLTKDSKLSDEDYDNLEQEFFDIYDNFDTTIKQKYQKQYDNVNDGKFKIIEKQDNKSLQLSIEKIKSTDNENALQTVKNCHNIVRRLLNISNLHKSDTFRNRVYWCPKFDGISLKITKTLISTQILTRGGQDFTKILYNNRDIQRAFKYMEDKQIGTIHGELLLAKNIFKDKYADKYANPRNAVVGVLKENPEDLNFLYYTDGTNQLFNKMYLDLSEQDIQNMWNRYYNYFKSDDYPYMIDGIVFTSIVSEQQLTAENSQYPNNFIALKFPASIVQTEVVDIEWTIKKSGKYTPVLKVKPVFIDGSTIDFVSAYSYHKLKEFKCGIGSIINITKGNDIIPKVVKTIKPSLDYKLPENIKLDGKHIFTTDSNDIEITDNYKFTRGLISLGIQGIGDTIASNLGNDIFNNDIIEIFNNQKKADVIEYLGVDSSNYSKFSEVYNIKKLTLDKLIYMMQFKDCGDVLSRRCANIITKQDMDTTGMNKSVLQNVCQGEGFRKIQESIKRLKEYGVTVIKPVIINENTLTYEMTGNPPSNLFKNKAEFVQKMSEKYPNSNYLSLTKTTNILFTDDLNGTSSKMNKARKYNIKIILYKDYEHI
jgi:DNA ligase